MGKVISVEDIENGMILAEPIMNSFGQTLIAAGAEIKECHKKLLKTWNIMTLVISKDDDEEDGPISDELKEIAVDLLKKRFKWEPRNNSEAEIFNLGVLFTADNIIKKGKDK